MLNRVLHILFFLQLISRSIYGQCCDPVANSASIIISGHARFTVLTQHVIRMEYSKNTSFTDEASFTFVNRNLKSPPYSTSEKDGWLVIKTKYYSLHYLKNSGPFTAKNLSIDYNDGHSNFTWKPGMKDDKNLKGTAHTLDGCSGKFSIYNFRKIKLEEGLLSKTGWHLIDDSQRPLFDSTGWVEGRTRGETQDLYFFAYGNDYKAALYDFTLLAGKISLPPKFAFGIWYSRFWAYTEADFKEIAAGYQKNNIPLDVLVIDMDWHITEKSSPEIFKQYKPKPNGWTGFTWEKKYFPDYKEFLAWTDSQRIQTCMNLHPASGIQQHEAAYPAFAKAMGVDPMTHQSIPFNITDKKFAQNYFDILLHPYEKDGVDFWWLDWQQWGNTKIKGVNPTFYLNYAHFRDMQQQGKRPLIFHRWGGLGNHRYEIGFSGDYLINWKSLAYQPEFTATAANVGFGYWSHDIGGHMNPVSNEEKHDPELYTRWVEWGAFSPIFRTHATADAQIERRMWKYPEANLNTMRKALQQRYALLPYIYTMARFAYDSGISIIRPMYYEFPEMERAYHLEHQYYFGNNIIVAPVTESMNGKKTIRQTVWLPTGNWYDLRNNNLIEGGKDFIGEYTLDEEPVFVKAGSIIPTQTSKLRVTGSVLDTLILTVYPDTFAAFNLYEDEGNSESYREDVCSFIKFSWQRNNNSSVFKIEPDGKTFLGQVTERSYEIKIVASEKPVAVKRNGKDVNWTYDAETKIVYIKTEKSSIKSEQFEIL